MSVCIVVPFRPDGAERDRNWEFVKARYQALYPEWQIVYGDGDRDGGWCKGAAANPVVQRLTDADKLVIADADMLLADEVMREAVERLDDFPWVVPHWQSYRLNEEATRRVLKEGPAFDVAASLPHWLHDDLEMPPRKMFRCGGMFFIRRDVYEDVGGFDERFVFWGGEDEALGLALTTLHGDPLELGSILLHLWHEPQPEMPPTRLRPEAKNALVQPYEAAQGDKAAMRRVLRDRCVAA